MCVAAAIAGAAVVGAGATVYASNKQSSAANKATDAANAQNALTNSQEAPFRTQGTNAVNELGNLEGTSGNTDAEGYGSLSHVFNAGDLKTNLAPNYDFQLQQGLGATQNAGAAAGFSGNTLKGINDYAQNYAGNAYQQAFNNYTANQTNVYNRLSNLAGLGQTANQVTAASGTQNTLNAGNFATSGAASQAAGVVGAANSVNNGLNNYAGWNYLNGGASSAQTGDGAYGSVSGGYVSPDTGAVFNNPSAYTAGG